MQIKKTPTTHLHSNAGWCLQEPCWVSSTLLGSTSKVRERGLGQLQPRYPGHHPTFPLLQLLPDTSHCSVSAADFISASPGCFTRQREEGDPGRGTDSFVLLSTPSPEPREGLLGLDLNFLLSHSLGSGPLQPLWIPRQM